MTPIERAARALCTLDRKDPDTVSGPGLQKSVALDLRKPGEGHFAWEEYVSEVLAVLRAIREPSEKMVEEGSSRFRDIGLQTRPAVTDAWHAMIDTAQAEG